jgi:hypothetical protein
MVISRVGGRRGWCLAEPSCRGVIVLAADRFAGLGDVGLVAGHDVLREVLRDA